MDQLEKIYSPKEVEERWGKYWEDNLLFHGDETSTKKSFSIVIPPPNVTGSLHMGHAFNNTLQDILARWKRMLGFEVLWQPGTDHAGIATQNVVERQLHAEGINRQEIGREEFIKRVWKWRKESGGTINHQLSKLGSSLDWKRDRFTMDEGLSKAVREVFVSLYEEGLIYKGDYIINWCPRCLTALSDLEVEHKETQGHLYNIRYQFKDSKSSLTIATTRPETLLGDSAVAVNPKDERYQNMIGKMLILPLLGRELPLIGDNYVDSSFGSGALKVTPAHDPNDFELGRRHDLGLINVMNPDGSMNEEAGPLYQGLDRFICRKKLVENLKTQTIGMDSDVVVLPPDETKRRAVRYFGWCFFVLIAATLVGLLPAMLIFLIGYLRFEAKESWTITLTVGISTWMVSYLLFHQLLRVPWPAAYLGDLLPGLRSIGMTNLL